MGKEKRSEIMNLVALTLSFLLSASILVKVIFCGIPVKACALGYLQLYIYMSCDSVVMYLKQV